MLIEAKNKLSEYSLAASILLLILGVTTIVPLSIMQLAFAKSCTVKLGDPSLETIHSAGIGALILAGEHVIIVTPLIGGCSSSNQAFVEITEVRNSDGETEYLSFQDVQLNGTVPSAIGGASWVPLHGGSYALRAFAISNLNYPTILFNVTISNMTIAANLGRAVVSILPTFYPNLERPDFVPQYIKVVIGINNTVE